MNKKKLIIGIVSLTLAVNPYIVAAEEITITDNGAGSSNNVTVNLTNNTQVQQSNEAQIQNNVEVQANTGNNTANENTGGETTIQTGDVNAQTQIVNTGINQSYAETGCCQGATNIKVNGNGADSSNTINYSQANNLNVNVNNTTNITNNVKGYANTGYNKANENNGSVSIVTGDITATDTIKNKSINISQVEASAGTGGSVYIAIANNGADSENTINVTDESSTEIVVENSANIVNNSQWELNTGNNEANKNSGEVKIATGDIVFTSTIENTDINISVVDVDCCGDTDNPNNPPDSNPPSNPTNPNPGTNPGNGSTSSQGGTTGPILPVTGGNFSLIFLAIVNVALFFLGGYLRLRSGRSPNLAF